MTVDLNELFRGVVRLETELWNRVDARLQHSHGVPLAWLDVLQTIAATPGCRVLDVARGLSITVGGASKVVDRVELAGLCRRDPNPADARSQLLRLTRSGAHLTATADRTCDEALRELIGDAVDAPELARLSATVQKLRTHLAASRAEVR